MFRGKLPRHGGVARHRDCSNSTDHGSAAENTCYFASVNCASEGSGTTSAIANPDGTLHSFQPYGQEGLLVADLDLSAATGLLAARCRTRSRPSPVSG